LRVRSKRLIKERAQALLFFPEALFSGT